MSGDFYCVHEVPILETERLKLRGHRLDDFTHCAAMWAEPAVTRHIGGRPFNEEESWARLLRYIGHWVLLGFGYWVVEEKTSGNFIGEIGFADYKRDVPELKDVPEIGWAFVPQAHGKGFATEAVRAVVGWGDGRFQHAATGCIVDPDNLASIHVAEKCGYRKVRVTTYRGKAVLMFIRDAPPK